MSDWDTPATEVRIGDLPLHPGQVLDYLYDLRDCWRFKLKLVSILPLDSTLKLPKIVEERGKAPQQYDCFEGEDDE